jgi:hypothetical protein
MMVGWFMVLNATFYNISVISWRSVLSVEETGEVGACSNSGKCICMLGVSILPFFYNFDILFWNCWDGVIFFFSFYL